MGTNEHGIVHLPKSPIVEEDTDAPSEEDSLTEIQTLLKRIHADVVTLNNRVGDLEKRQEKTETQQKDLTHEIKKLTAHIGVLQVETRKNNIQLAEWNQTCAARCDAVNVIVEQLHETTRDAAALPSNPTDNALKTE